MFLFYAPGPAKNLDGNGLRLEEPELVLQLHREI